MDEVGGRLARVYTCWSVACTDRLVFLFRKRGASWELTSSALLSNVSHHIKCIDTAKITVQYED